MNEDITQIASGIHRLSSVMGRIADRVLQEHYEFGMTQFKIIWVLYNHREDGGVRQSDIATWLSQTEAAISRQIRPMSKQKLLESTVDPKNRRSHLVRLTAEGEALAREAMQTLMAVNRQYFDKLTKKQQTDLADMLTILFNGAVVCLNDL